MNSDELDRLLELADCFDTGSLIARLAAALRSLRPDAERWRRVEGPLMEWYSARASGRMYMREADALAAALDALPRRKM